MNSLIKLQQNAPTSVAEARANVLAKVAALKEKGVAPRKSDRGVQYMSLNGNTGALTIGRDRTEVPVGSKFVVPLEGAAHGHIKWQGKKVIEERMGAVLDGPAPLPPEGEPFVGDLPKPRERDGWVLTTRLSLTGYGGELDGIIVSFEGGSAGVTRAMQDLMSEMVDTASDTPQGKRGFFNPVIEIVVDSYMNTQYDREVFFPTFEIVDWTDGLALWTSILANEEGAEEIDTDDEAALAADILG